MLYIREVDPSYVETRKSHKVMAGGHRFKILIEMIIELAKLACNDPRT